MKTLKTLGLLLLLATGVLAQPTPSDMFIDGYVVDVNGQAIANQTVCVSYVSNNPVLPSDTICSNTNANGYFSLFIPNGSLTGPNVSFDVSTYDPCALLPVVQTVENIQGTVDNATLTFAICATGTGNCNVSLTASNDSTNGPNGLWTFTANPTGTAPFTYDWWVDGASYSTQTVTHTFNGGTIGVYVTVTDANGCTSTAADTLFLNGNPTPCGGYIEANATPIGTTLEAVATGGTPPYAYQWSNGDNAQITTVNSPGVYCLTITDVTGCLFTTCDTIGNPNNCSVSITTAIDSSGGGLVYTLTASGGFNQYVWSNNQVGQTITVQQVNPNGEVICVNATDANGCTATACDTLLPNQGGNCNADFWYQMNATGSLVVEDTVVVLYTGSQSNANTYAWTVEFGGQVWTSASQDLILPIPPTLVPIGGVTVNVCVTVTDAATSCTDTYCETVTLVQPNTNSCSVSINSVQDPNNPLLFNLTANPTGTAPFTYSWDNGSTTQNTPYVLNGFAIYGACVSVTDATGCVTTACDTLIPDTTLNNNCNALFSWAESNILGAPLPAAQFTDQSAGAAYWYWDFGDGATSTDQNPLHLYSGNGPFVVCLTVVTANQQCQSTYCDTLYLNTNPGNCSALFSNSGLTPIGYTFSANVQNPNLDYYWTIDNQFVGDGYEAYAPGFTNGVHTVCLSVVDSLNNCFDQQCQTITVGSNNCYGYVSGAVFAGSNNQPLDEGVVYLILHDPVTNTLTAIDSMVVDSGNYYFFGPLACGDYLIKAAAYSGSQYYSNHIPTYYGNSPFWGFAQTVSLNQPNTQVTADVTLIAANNSGGPGFIGGDVTQGANKTDPGDPLSGMQVMLYDLAGNAVAYTYTNVDGEFGFSNIAYGTYQVYVEVLGVQTIPAVVTIGPDEPTIGNVHILASESLISTGIEEFDFDGAISEVYPNPVINAASINFNLESEVAVDVAVLDLTGRAISVQTITVAGGEYAIRIDVENLKDGYYFLNIQDVNGTFSVTRKFMRVD